MKYFLALLLFSLFGLLNYFTPGGKAFFYPENERKNDSVKTAAYGSIDTLLSTKSTYSSSAKRQLPVKYYIDATFDETTTSLKVNQSFVWINTSSAPATEMFIHIYPNAYKAGSAFFEGSMPDEKFLTSLVFDSIAVDGIPARLQYVNTDILYKSDSTVAKFPLPKMVGPGDSVLVHCSYKYSIPRALGRMGYSPNRDFYFFAQWFVKPGVFENGKWICSPYFPYAEFYADFAEYTINLHTPEGFQVQGSGSKQSVKTAAGKMINHEFRAINVHDFAWCATKGFPVEKYNDRSVNGREIQFTITYPQTYSELLPRYKATLQSAFRYFENTLGPYPYKSFTLAIVPQNSGRIGSMEYPGMATVQHNQMLFTSSLEIEKLIVHEFAHQYFYGAVANNESYEGWIDEGLASYLTSGMLDAHGLSDISSFKLFGHYPVQGLELLSIEELPLIYTLTKITVPNQSTAMKAYMAHANEAALSDSSYLLSTHALYNAITYGKSELFFKTLERMIGRQKFLKMLSRFYATYQFKHITAAQLFNSLQANSPRNLQWYFRNFYEESFICDYAVKGVEYFPGSRECRVDIRRNGEAFFPCEVSLVSPTDTLTKTINNNRRFFSVYFKCNQIPTGAEIDLHRKNYFDVNFANNSKMIEKQYASTIYFSMRWFFWIQNLLLIFGSLA